MAVVINNLSSDMNCGEILTTYKLIEHRHYIGQHGEDLPEICNWKWGRAKANTPRGKRSARRG